MKDIIALFISAYVVFRIGLYCIQDEQVRFCALIVGTTIIIGWALSHMRIK